MVRHVGQIMSYGNQVIQVEWEYICVHDYFLRFRHEVVLQPCTGTSLQTREESKQRSPPGNHALNFVTPLMGDELLQWRAADGAPPCSGMWSNRVLG